MGTQETLDAKPVAEANTHKDKETDRGMGDKTDEELKVEIGVELRASII